MKLEPTDGRIVVRKTHLTDPKSKIILPESVKGQTIWEVVSVGPGKTLESGQREEMNVQKGDRLIAGSYAGTKVELEKEEFYIMDWREVLAIVR